MKRFKMSTSRRLAVTFLCVVFCVMSRTCDAQFQQNSARARDQGLSIPTIQVISTNPPDGQIIKQGQTVTLTCSTNVNWFFCVWRSPGGGKQCAIQETTTQNVCSGDQRMILKGRQNKCEIELRNVKPEDRGQWTCLLTDAEYLGTDKSTIDIEVAVPANVRFDPGFGETGILRLTEGDVTEIRCAATGGFPAPQLSWSEPAEADVDFTAEPEIVTMRNDHTTDVYHTIKYRASLRDNNTVFTCIATQLDLNGKDVIYESSTALLIKVDKIVLPPVDNALTQKIGIISGVLISIIFLILLIVVIVFLVCKRRRKRSRPPSSQATDDTSPETHTSVIKPIWTTDRGMVTAPNHNLKTYRDEDPKFQRSQNILRQHSSNDRPLISHTISQGTVSTQSTASQGSWEEDRSVGGEIEDASIQRSILPQPLLPRSGVKTPSLHETHFDSDLELPRTVLHHPDPYQIYQNAHQLPVRSQQLLHQRQPPQAGLNGRPSSSMADSWQQPPSFGNGGGQRPTSALAGPGCYDTLGARHMPAPNCHLTTSVKSVFDCDQGCFVNSDGDHVMCGGGDGGGPISGFETSALVTSSLKPETATSEPRDV